jgi:hypothetical protein
MGRIQARLGPSLEQKNKEESISFERFGKKRWGGLLKASGMKKAIILLIEWLCVPTSNAYGSEEKKNSGEDGSRDAIEYNA